VGKAELGQVVDREGLAACRGALGRLRIAVPAAWSDEGAEIEIAAPGRVACARCDGGGCDGCGRSGAHRIPGEPGARTLRLRLPGSVDPGAAVVLRVARPFDEAPSLEQLLVEVTAGAEPSPGVTRVPPAVDSPAGARPLRAVTVATVIAAVLALLAALAASR
jgi:hypothetical protein